MYGSILYNTYKYALHECIDVYMPIYRYLNVWMYADRLYHERHLQQHILVFLPTYMHPKYKYALYECMDVCRSSQPRAPSLPGADLGSGTHHATTLAILSHCQHADADGADGADAVRGIIQKTKQKFEMEFSIKRRTSPPTPPLMDIIPIHFLSHFFSFANES